MDLLDICIFLLVVFHFEGLESMRKKLKSTEAVLKKGNLEAH